MAYKVDLILFVKTLKIFYWFPIDDLKLMILFFKIHLQDS